MSETQTVTPTAPADGAVVAKPTETLFAGKYKTPEALEQGYRELSKAAGDEFPADAKLIGEGGMFTSHVALERGYLQMAKLFSRGSSKPEAKADTKAPETNELGIKADTPATQAAAIKNAEDVVKAAGLDGRALAEKFAKEGQLSADDYAKLASQGRSRAEVDQFLTGQKALAELREIKVGQAVSKVEQMLGGKEQHEALRKWAAENMPAAELKRLSDTAESDPEFYPTMMELINTRYNSKIGAGGSRPLINGQAPSTSAQPVSSIAEFAQLNAAALRGDRAAQERIALMPMEQLQKWSRI